VIEERKHHYLGYLPVACEVRAVADPDPDPSASETKTGASCPFGWSSKTCRACPYAGCPMR
jgi:hypothetical protein